MTTSTNRMYITYLTVTRRGLSYDHSQRVQNLFEELIYANRQTDKHTCKTCNTLHLGRVWNNYSNGSRVGIKKISEGSAKNFSHWTKQWVKMLNNDFARACTRVVCTTLKLAMRHISLDTVFSARCNIYISRLCYDVSVRLSVRLSVTEVHWRFIANSGFKFRSQFTAHCGRGACGLEGGKSGGIISRYASNMGLVLVFYHHHHHLVYFRP